MTQLEKIREVMTDLESGAIPDAEAQERLMQLSEPGISDIHLLEILFDNGMLRDTDPNSMSGARAIRAVRVILQVDAEIKEARNAG